MKYPNIIFFRFNKYSDIDSYLLNKSYNCTFNITDNVEDLNRLFNPNYHLLITFGDTEKEYHNIILPNIVNRFANRWIHKSKKHILNIEEFNSTINYCYINNVIMERRIQRPEFSVFTTCYNTWDKFDRVYNSLKNQNLKDWEWVIIDDTPLPENGKKNHFDFLRDKCKNDSRIRLYCRSENSGNIGNVKNEAVSLCRGKYILELDHDDEILPDCLVDAAEVFDKDDKVGFIYMDFINIYENGENFSYGDFICKGYGGYYCQKYKDKWVNVYITPNINNITLSHLVCCPNHPRIWRKSVLLSLENYSEFLPICDDYEILLKTALNTKIVKIHKLGYIQYMNDGNSNFSLIRNSEINRIGPNHIFPQFYQMYNVNDKMKQQDAYEDENFIFHHSQIWKRENYTHKYCNKLVNLDYDNQYCIINDNIDNEELVELYKNPRNDFLFLSNNLSHDEMIQKLEEKGFDRMKCYSLLNVSKRELKNYFKLLYANSNCQHEILDNNSNIIETNIYQLDTQKLKEQFKNNIPFNHIVLDSTINPDFLKKMENEIRNLNLSEITTENVYGIDNVQVNKFSCRDFSKFKYTNQAKDYFESDDFLKWLSIITGIDNLQKDEFNHGNGIHIIKENGKLDIHADFNRHSESKKYRRLNLLLYLNSNYEDKYNGKLELWNKEMTKCEKKIAPIFNRIVIFKIDDDANHGHPALWKSSLYDRLSLALYYYTDNRPEYEKSDRSFALWKTPNINILNNNNLDRNSIKNGLICLIGESFRLGNETTRNRGSTESYSEQIKACYSHIKFIENIKKKFNIDNISVFISSYTTQFDNKLLSIYNNYLIGNDFYPDVIGIDNLFHNTINKIENIQKYDFIHYIRIDLFLKNYFIDIFNPTINMILFPTITWKKMDKIENDPRVNDTSLFIPKKYFKYLNNIRIGHEIWNELIKTTDLTYDDMDVIINTYHDSDSFKDFNPLYYIVNREQNNIFHSDGHTFNKYNYLKHKYNKF